MASKYASNLISGFMESYKGSTGLNPITDFNLTKLTDEYHTILQGKKGQKWASRFDNFKNKLESDSNITNQERHYLYSLLETAKDSYLRTYGSKRTQGYITKIKASVEGIEDKIELYTPSIKEGKAAPEVSSTSSLTHSYSKPPSYSRQPLELVVNNSDVAGLGTPSSYVPSETKEAADQKQAKKIGTQIYVVPQITSDAGESAKPTTRWYQREISLKTIAASLVAVLGIGIAAQVYQATAGEPNPGDDKTINYADIKYRQESDISDLARARELAAKVNEKKDSESIEAYLETSKEAQKWLGLRESKLTKAQEGDSYKLVFDINVNKLNSGLTALLLYNGNTKLSKAPTFKLSGMKNQFTIDLTADQYSNLNLKEFQVAIYDGVTHKVYVASHKYAQEAAEPSVDRTEGQQTAGQPSADSTGDQSPAGPGGAGDDKSKPAGSPQGSPPAGGTGGQQPVGEGKGKTPTPIIPDPSSLIPLEGYFPEFK